MKCLKLLGVCLLCKFKGIYSSNDETTLSMFMSTVRLPMLSRAIYYPMWPRDNLGLHTYYGTALHTDLQS